MHLNPISAESEEEFVSESVRVLTEAIKRAFEKHDSCMLGLSGGSTPRPIYEALGKEDLDWSKISIFLVDERYVLPDHKDSNQKMVSETLLKDADIPESNIYFPDTTLPIEECMEDYSSKIKGMIDAHGWLPDVFALGMGPDGHIASIFPPVPEEALTDQNFVLHTTTDEFAVHDRITLTLNVIAAAQEHVFFLKGEDKKQMWEEMMESEEDERRWPAKRILEGPNVSVISYW